MHDRRWRTFSRRGVLLPTIFFILTILALFAMQYSRWATYSRALAYRYEQSEVARRLAEAALDEAFARFCFETGKPGSTVRKLLIDNEKSPGIAQAVAVPVILAQAPDMTRGLTPDITVTVRSVDFRDNSPTPKNYPFYGKEGVGTLGFTAVVNLLRGSRRVGRCVIERHHDFKVNAVLLGPRSGRPLRYAQSFLLDYALFVRNGLSEFRSTNGYTLNNDYLNFTIMQDGATSGKYGKIFFGGTDNQNNFVFLNVPQALQNMIPPFSQTISLTDGECGTLWPKLAGQVSMAAELRMSNVPAWRPSFSPPLDIQKEAINGLICCAANSWEGQASIGVNLLSDNSPSPVSFVTAANAHLIFEGNVRQRFLYYDEFQFTKIGGQAPPAPNNCIACLPLAAAQKRGAGPIAEQFCQGLKTLETSKGNLISNFNTDYLYADASAKNTTFTPPPKFLDNASQIVVNIADARLKPYNHINLQVRTLQTQSELQTLGYLDVTKGELRIRGILRVFDDVVFDKPLKIIGQGVLIANSFYLREKLVKSDPANDFIVLYAREGNISIDTSNEIDAALVAINDNADGRVRVQPGKKMNLKGMLAADYLDTSAWPSGLAHVIHYDPAFQPADDQYQVNISNWITFMRMTEDESANNS
ncbi:MAG: hypothetical protein HQM09_22220 [Candidatus Riflebacteria bacterium]|nr:hypothetical protein [Candidatus Riflebacteria bacterium]